MIEAIRRCTVGRTVLLVTHDRDLAELADRVVVLDQHAVAGLRLVGSQPPPVERRCSHDHDPHPGSGRPSRAQPLPQPLAQPFAQPQPRLALRTTPIPHHPPHHTNPALHQQEEP